MLFEELKAVCRERKILLVKQNDKDYALSFTKKVVHKQVGPTKIRMEKYEGISTRERNSQTMWYFASPGVQL